MMTFNAWGHITLAVVVASPLIGNTEAYAPYITFVVFGSLLPDVDHPYSTLGKFNPAAPWMKHRGHCHTLAGTLLLSAPVLLVGLDAACAVWFGALIHIWSDKLYSWFPGRSKFKIRIW